jgi:urease alpha subunit
LEKEIGSIEVGKKADMITFDLRQPHLYPPDMIAVRLVTNASGNDVNDVVVGGRVVMRDRRMTTVDEGAVLDRAVDMYRQTIERGSLQDMTKPRDGFWKAARYSANRRPSA